MHQNNIYVYKHCHISNEYMSTDLKGQNVATNRIHCYRSVLYAHYYGHDSQFQSDGLYAHHGSIRPCSDANHKLLGKGTLRPGR